MDAQAVTVGARLGRRLNLVILAASKPAADRASFFGGLLATIAGCIAGTVGPQTAAELLRISIAKLEGQPQLELPPGVRLAIASAEDAPRPAANDSPAMETVGSYIKNRGARSAELLVDGEEITLAPGQELEIKHYFPARQDAPPATVDRTERLRKAVARVTDKVMDASLLEADLYELARVAVELSAHSIVTPGEMRVLASGWIFEIPGVHRTDKELRAAAENHSAQPGPEDDVPVSDILRRIFGLAARPA